MCRIPIALFALLLLAGSVFGESRVRAAPNLENTAAHPVAPASLARVQAIKRGLKVAPRKKKYAKAKVKQPLYGKYALRTGAGQLASIAFADGSLLHINQHTDLGLQSSSITKVNQGEVDEIVQPGTSHQVTTPVATAIGAEYDTNCVSKTTRVVTVVEGAVLVTGMAGGSVTVKTNQQTTVRKGKAP